MKSFHEELRKKYENHYSSLGLKNLTELVIKRIKGEVGEEQAKEIKKYLKLSGKILDVGCGTAEFLVKVASHCEVHGIEPDADFVKLARMRMKINGVEGEVIRAVGEHLPFKDNSFDIVTSFSVLEHVQDPLKVIDEMLRVSKKFVYIHFPNYAYPYEPHYKIFWIPLIPKIIGKIYLRIRGRNASFLDDINYITARKVMKYLAKKDVEVKNAVIERIKNPDLVVKHRTLAQVIKFFPYLSNLISYISPGVDIVIEKKLDSVAVGRDNKCSAVFKKYKHEGGDKL